MDLSASGIESTTQALSATGAGAQDLMGELLSHLDAFIQYMKNGQFARAGQELEAIASLRSRLKR